MHTDRRDTTEHRRTYFILFSTSLSQFIDVSHLQVEAFNLDSGVTQPQLSFTAATVIIPGLKCNGKKIFFLCFIWRLDHWHWYIWTVTFTLWSNSTGTVSGDPKKDYMKSNSCVLRLSITTSLLLRLLLHWHYIYSRDVISWGVFWAV